MHYILVYSAPFKGGALSLNLMFHLFSMLHFLYSRPHICARDFWWIPVTIDVARLANLMQNITVGVSDHKCVFSKLSTTHYNLIISFTSGLLSVINNWIICFVLIVFITTTNIHGTCIKIKEQYSFVTRLAVVR